MECIGKGPHVHLVHRPIVDVRGNSLNFDASIVGGNSLSLLFVANPVCAVQSVSHSFPLRIIFGVRLALACTPTLWIPVIVSSIATPVRYGSGEKPINTLVYLNPYI